MHWIFELIGGIALLVVGFILGGTAAFYKGWDEGFREGYDKESRERAEARLSVASCTSQGREQVRVAGPKDFPTRKAS